MIVKRKVSKYLRVEQENLTFKTSELYLGYPTKASIAVLHQLFKMNRSSTFLSRKLRSIYDGGDVIHMAILYLMKLNNIILECTDTSITNNFKRTSKSNSGNHSKRMAINHGIRANHGK